MTTDLRSPFFTRLLPTGIAAALLLLPAISREQTYYITTGTTNTIPSTAKN